MVDTCDKTRHFCKFFVNLILELMIIIISAFRHIYSFKRYTQVPQQFSCSMLNTMTQPDTFNSGIIINRPRIYRHRIRIINQPSIRAEFFHVTADIKNDRDMAQTHENTSGANCIAATQFDSIKFCRRIREQYLRSSNPDRHKNIIGAFQSFSPV